MRKLICLITVLLLCVSFAAPVFAAEESGFVPSITYKPSPTLMTVAGDNGEEYIGVVRNAEGEIIDYVSTSCLMITPIAHIWDEDIEVIEEIEELLQFVYNGLTSNSMEIPYDKHGADLNPANMVIRDLFDVRWGCEEHPKMLEPEGVVLELTFDLGVVADAQIFVQTYNEEADEWSPIVACVNNGDGTVTCTLEHLCVVEFSMPIAAAATAVTPAEEAENPSVLPWVALLIAAAGAVVSVVVINKKKTAV